MFRSLLLALLIPPYLAAANFAIVFGTPSSPCRGCLQGIYSTCAASNTYSEGQTSDFSNCICGLDSFGEAAICLTGECMDLTQSPYINSMYNSWCLRHNAIFRREACAQTGFTRDYFEMYTGDVFTSACNGDDVDGVDDTENRGGGVDDAEVGGGRDDGNDADDRGDDDVPESDFSPDSDSASARFGDFVLGTMGTISVVFGTLLAINVVA